jgi:phosphate-selective porin OprO/OprP
VLPKLRILTRTLLLPAACAAWLTVMASAQGSADSTLETELLDLLREKGIITAEEHDSLLAEAQRRADARGNELTLIESSLQRLAAPDVQARGGTSGKLVFRSPDGKWSLGVKGYVQGRIENLDSDDDTKDARNISAARARLAVEGNAGAPNIRYRMELDASTNSRNVDPATENNVTPRDIYADIGFLGTNSVRLGQFKFPMGREQLTSTSAIAIQDLSIATQEFTPSYEPAAMVLGSVLEGVLEYQVAVSNGEGRGKNNTVGTEKNGMRNGARVVWNPLGAIKLDGPAFQTVDDGSARLGLGASWMHNEDSTGLNTVTPDSDATTTGFEAGFLLGPLSAMAETFRRTNDPDTGGSFKDTGWNYQLGWLLGPAAAWELVARLSTIDFGAKDDQVEKTLGLNWYLDRHNSKWMLDFSQLSGDGAVPDADRIRLQFQAMF